MEEKSESKRRNSPARPFPRALYPEAATTGPTIESVLMVFSVARLQALSRVFGCETRETAANKEKLVRLLATELAGRLPAVLRELGRDELRTVCRAHGRTDSSRARLDLQEALLAAAGLDPKAASIRPPDLHPDGLPQKGQVVNARHRQWLVEDVQLGTESESPLVKLVCLDDDDPGRALDVLWDLELGAQVVASETHGLGEITKLDPPFHFGAYLHALKWSAVSAADATRFQAPFRAGIKIMAHQLTPLMKALELPRANLFIADDVGLGKTIEAGLVLQELLLRQQADFVLIVCPASVCLQWQGEMQRRFGLRFEVMTRQFVSYRRQERGFGTNPWSTHSKFIVSHSLLRRPEYRDPLLNHLGDRAKKGLLILDEAHVAAPAAASKYAVDTDITRAIRDLAPRFDNRLFLSATPHNGHSNSFSALLEILDPARFSRGIPVDGKKDLEPIMVRRLKRDLRKLGVESFPRRLLVELALTNTKDAWKVTERSFDAETGAASVQTEREIGAGSPTELVLAEKLQRYTELRAPTSGQGRLPFIHLQQRLLSSPEAFARSLQAHAVRTEEKGAVKAPGPKQAKLQIDIDPETYGESDEAAEDEERAAVDRASAELPTPTEEARELLSQMRALAEKARRQPDAKTQTLLAWLREHLCPAIGLGADTAASRRFTNTRVILFTEYADTKRYLVEILEAALAHTDEGERRVLQFHGGMGDESRDEVQRAFNSDPEEHPARILVATDAAREGVNLQAHCADLFHIDIPWNPARLEQRNGRIDRTLQPAPEVRCHYFVYPDRAEDRVLETVVKKIAIVERELGSLGAVILSQIESVLQNGIGRSTQGRVEQIGKDAQTTTVDAELEAPRKDLVAMRAENDRAARRYEASRKLLEAKPDSLRGVVEVGLTLARGNATEGAVGSQLTVAGKTSDDKPTYILPKLDRTWDSTLDTLRPARGRDAAFWEWRKTPPRPVTFHPLKRMSEDSEQLHLAHPLVKRILDRFLAQGFGAHDLSRVTALVAPDESVVRVVAFARLTLFGAGAARLHDEIVALSGAWSGESSQAGDVRPYKDRATLVNSISLVEGLLASGARSPNTIISQNVLGSAKALFGALWPDLEAEADALAVEARKGLAERARRESDGLRALLERQREGLLDADARLRSLSLFDVQDRDQKRQLELDLKHVGQRQIDIEKELLSEPQAIEALYDVRMSRLTPVGLVVAYPEAMT